MMDGMTMTISLELNGEIVETNASYVDDTKITMLEIDFSEILKNKETLELFKRNPPDNLDEMKAIVENIPGMKVDRHSTPTRWPTSSRIWIGFRSFKNRS